MTWPSPKARRSAKAYRERIAREAKGPTLPKPCRCEKPMPVAEPGEFARCLKCGRGLAQ